MNATQAIHGLLSDALQSGDVHLLGEALELSPATRGLLAVAPQPVDLLPAGGIVGLRTTAKSVFGELLAAFFRTRAACLSRPARAAEPDPTLRRGCPFVCAQASSARRC